MDMDRSSVRMLLWLLALFPSTVIATFGMVRVFEGRASLALALAGLLSTACLVWLGIIGLRWLARLSGGVVVSGDPVSDRFATESGPVIAPLVATLIFMLSASVAMVSLEMVAEAGRPLWIVALVVSSGIAVLAGVLVIRRLRADARLAARNEPFMRERAIAEPETDEREGSMSPSQSSSSR